MPVNLAQLLKVGGILHIATDNKEYAEGCQDILDNAGQFEPLDEIPIRPITKFARKAMDKGVEITDIAVSKAK